jgi:hypothetical protein
MLSYRSGEEIVDTLRNFEFVPFEFIFRGIYNLIYVLVALQCNAHHYRM